MHKNTRYLQPRTANKIYNIVQTKRTFKKQDILLQTDLLETV